ncbi:uroporphyrinogen-III C-methyltransferase [Thalassotalea sediminis]|uniref:uroporphyrinogen-III C-methyltransferase n=1 Tax=Thalassotalea sediminis TaxID=1759089 RepID=UPI0025722168|nr:uroporphyrinogen-III C-methyltransferase [Thalassotalea sediminis]
MTAPTSPDNKTPNSKKEALGSDKDNSEKTTVDTKREDVKKSTPSAAPIKHTSNTISKTAVFAVLLSIVALAGIGALFYWQQQVAAERQTLIEAQLQSSNRAALTLIEQRLETQKIRFNETLKQALDTVQATNDNRIAQLNAQISRLSQSSPQDWLIHEAEYLIRVASRTMWLERDTIAAINLLSDADERLKELNAPKFLPIRQQIRKDIETLKQLPTLATEEVTLTLIALEEQIWQLPLAMAKVPEPVKDEDNLTLSNSTADWRENLAKTWHRFKEDFITIRRRNGSVEPLMSPSHQQNLKENLSLKLQQAQWAASKENEVLYIALLDKAQAWLFSYFDTSQEKTIKFNNVLQKLKSETIKFDYPTTLQSLNAIRNILRKPALEKLPDENHTEQPSGEQVKPAQNTNQEEGGNTI